MKWWPDECKSGDIVRIKLGSIYHYGIFVSEEEIIQFGPPPVQLSKINDKDIEVLATDIQTFSCGNIIEVAQLERKEKKQARKPDQIVEFARKSLGMKGYNLLHNNCEHFVNLCVFGIKRSEQEEQARAKWANRSILDVYVSKVPENLTITEVFPPERDDKIKAITNEEVKAEKFWVWKTLEYAFLRTFGYTMEAVNPKLQKSGKWVTQKKDCYFTLSHSNGIVAVAVSNSPVGIDIEELENFNHRFEKNPQTLESFLNKILDENQLAQLNASGSDKTARNNLIAVFWTQKEATFKCTENKTGFIPKKVKIDSSNIITKTDKINESEYCLSICSNITDAVRYYTFSADKA